MTKERKIAIELWEAMREMVINGKIRDIYSMQAAKRIWLEARGINWYSDCWFCQYFRKDIEDDYCDSCEDEEEITPLTPKCPLNYHRPSICYGRCQQYSIACSKKYPMEQRLAAVDNIIKALKGEFKE